MAEPAVEEKKQNMNENVINVLITGAAGQIGYSLIPLFATGLVFGANQPINLRLLEIDPAMRSLRGVVMEINDGAYPLVNSIQLANANKNDDEELPAFQLNDRQKEGISRRFAENMDDRETKIQLAQTAIERDENLARDRDLSIQAAFTDVDYCVFVGGFPRGPGMKRADLLAKNAPIFLRAGDLLEEYAKVDTKVLVIANPANSNCLMCAMRAPKIPKANFAALTRLDMNRARSQLAGKLGVGCSAITNVIIWGNHSATQVPDVNSGKVMIEGKEKPLDLAHVLADDAENAHWLANEFVPTVQTRGKAIIAARGLSSAMSAANAVKDCLRDWVLGTPPREHVAMAVYTEEGNPYLTEGNPNPDEPLRVIDSRRVILPGLFYSFPCECDGTGAYRIVGPDKINVSEPVCKAMIASQEELREERETVVKMNNYWNAEQGRVIIPEEQE